MATDYNLNNKTEKR